MSRFLCLLAISSSLLACSGDDCGSPGSANYGLVASSDQVTLAYGNLMARAGNDCPVVDQSIVVSLTIEGTQMGSGGGLLTLCIPRPDQLNAAVSLGTDVKLVQLTGMDDTCSYKLDSGHIPSGKVTGKGVCSDGTDKAGFGLVFDGFIGLTRTCGTTIDTVSVGLTGDVEVTPTN